MSFKARVIPDNHIWMEDAKLKNVILCQPEYRNRFNKVWTLVFSSLDVLYELNFPHEQLAWFNLIPANKHLFQIFGGFLMRQAFELGWVNAHVYARQRPYIEFMDDILFQAPVDIGSLLLFNSQVWMVMSSLGHCTQILLCYINLDSLW